VDNQFDHFTSAAYVHVGTIELVIDCSQHFGISASLLLRLDFLLAVLTISKCTHTKQASCAY